MVNLPNQNKENEEAIQLLLKKHDEELNEWEVEFLESIYTQLKQKGYLTEKQVSKLNSIWRCVMFGREYEEELDA